MMKRRVAYVTSKELLLECDRSFQFIGRATLVHELIKTYNLVDHMKIVESRRATEEEIKAFHSGLYVEFLQKINDSTDLEVLEEEAEQYGLGYDCPLLEKLYDFVQAIAGSSICGAEILVQGNADVVINWCGGWHHAQRDEAEGYCYVNDIVLAIHTLRQQFKRVLYIDLDAHHGNGVENAFSCSASVMTFSIHKHEPGFYPGSGDLSDVGSGHGRYYTVNVPLAEGIRDDLYTYMFDSVMLKIWAAFRPEAVVVQCGADGLNGDPLRIFNLTEKGLAHCVKRVLTWKLPTLFLGGGGYCPANVARCWAYLTSVILDEEIDSHIPEHEYILEYGPGFELEIVPGCRKDCNTRTQIDKLLESVVGNLDKVALATL